MRLSLLPALALVGLASAAVPPAVGAATDAAPAGAAPGEGTWRQVELYFGIGAWHSATAIQDERRWRDFLDREVTPRFPQGLTVLDAYGQWLPPRARHPERLHSKLLLIIYADTPGQRSALEAIRSAWKQRTGDVSVLRVDTPVDASF